ncbi:MAG: ATP phosphoribosyltransferase [Pseudomonadota bacterium]
MNGLTLAIPSKGRLKDQCEAFLSACGFSLRQAGGDRGYRAVLSGLEGVDVLLLSASEIARGLIEGAFQIGVTGEDLLHEYAGAFDRELAVIKPLGFGRADAVVAVPQSWLDVSTMADLEAAGALFRARHGRRMRVATKYLRLTRAFFASRSVGEYRLIESAGATEAAPASGAAELIVDITSTGSTLKANALKVLDDGVILKSQAALTGSLKADWTEDALGALRLLLDRIEARAAGDSKRVLFATKPIPADTASALDLELADDRRRASVAADHAADAAARLAGEGFGPVNVLSQEFLFQASNPVFEHFLGSLRQSP